MRWGVFFHDFGYQRFFAVAFFLCFFPCWACFAGGGGSRNLILLRCAAPPRSVPVPCPHANVARVFAQPVIGGRVSAGCFCIRILGAMEPNFGSGRCPPSLPCLICCVSFGGWLGASSLDEGKGMIYEVMYFAGIGVALWRTVLHTVDGQTRPCKDVVLFFRISRGRGRPSSLMPFR